LVFRSTKNFSQKKKKKQLKFFFYIFSYITHTQKFFFFFFHQTTHIIFTISKSKLALLKEISENPEPTQKPIHSNVEDGLAVISGAPIGYKNCTALKEYYPKWSKKGHPAYASKHDVDKDGWACEPIGK